MTSTSVLLATLMIALASPAAHAQVTSGNAGAGPRIVPRTDLKTEAGQRVGLPFISDVRIVPSASSAIISFKSSERTPPLVEVSRAPAAPDRFGILTFPVGTSAFTRFVQPQDGRYTLNLDVNNEQLEAGTTYYYIINVFNDNQNDPRRKREQQTGAFSTFTQSVRVVWEKILILDDSDDDSAGEVSIWGWANYGSPGQQAFVINDLGDNSAADGQAFPLDHAADIENAPNDLALSVSGIEDDRGPFSNIARGDGIGEPLGGPSSDTNFTRNVARDTLDLTRFPSEPGETRSYQFKLASMPGGKLGFEIYGHFEITRKAR